MSTEIDWADIARRLAAPFDPSLVDFRAGDTIYDDNKTAQRNGKEVQLGSGQALAYVDARVIMDRLDAVVGCQNWTFIPTALSFDGKQGVATALGALTIHGITKYDFADASNFEGTKGCASDSLKRAAVHWGPGRYLYDLPRYKATYVAYSKKDNKWQWRLEDTEIARLRGLLPRPEEPDAAQSTTANSARQGAERGTAAQPSPQAERPAPVPKRAVLTTRLETACRALDLDPKQECRDLVAQLGRPRWNAVTDAELFAHVQQLEAAVQPPPAAEAA